MNKLYVLIRSDLSESYKAVQAGHAVAEFCLKQRKHDWNNGTMVYLKVKNEEKLLDWAYKLKVEKVPFEIFTEPDIGNEHTALATVSDGEMFRKLRLI